MASCLIQDRLNLSSLLECVSILFFSSQGRGTRKTGSLSIFASLTPLVWIMSVSLKTEIIFT